MSVRWVAPASGDGSASSGRAEEPATAAGRRLWEGYQAVVAKRPDVDGILWLKAITDIEAEAAGLRAAHALTYCEPCSDCESKLAALAATPEQEALDERPGKHTYSALCTPVSDEFDDPWCYCDMHNYAEVTA